jgi:hypothetical protein
MRVVQVDEKRTKVHEKEGIEVVLWVCATINTARASYVDGNG